MALNYKTPNTVIASPANAGRGNLLHFERLLRRFAPRNDEKMTFVIHSYMEPL